MEAPDLRVPLREIILSEGAGEPNLPVYDTSGPYTDPNVVIDVNKGLPRLRTAWVLERGGVEEYEGREIKPEDNGNVGAAHAAKSFTAHHRPLRGLSVPSPLAGSEASEARSRGRGGGSTSRGSSKVHKPHLDEMHGPESLPFRPNRAPPRKPSPDDLGGGSKIFQPTDSRQSGPEFGPAPRSSGGAPGHRGGWKKR